MTSLLYRPIQLVASLFAGLLLVALMVLGVLTWRTLERLDHIRTAVNQIASLQGVGLRAEDILRQDRTGEALPDGREVHRLGQELARIISPEQNLSRSSAQKLKEALALLTVESTQPRQALVRADALMREALREETRAEEQFLREIDEDARAEMKLAAAMLFLFPLFSAIAIWLLSERIFRPIDNLKELLSRIANGDFAPINTARIDPLLSPLFSNYNQMVARLEELEHVHRRHAVTLEDEVRSATQALLLQQQNLARAERLAAVGELAALVAHELRNPLAGMQMALSNLRQELNEPEVVERLDLVTSELQRITRLLNDLLSQSRQAPEIWRLVDVALLVHELLALTRYQTPAGIVLRDEIANDLECRLPADGLRQALLNLVLNAIQSLGEQTGVVIVIGKREGRVLRIAVDDDGPGFSGALLAGGVRPFASSRDSGNGLGLAMVQRFARDAEGELQLFNLKPRGARAELVLPCGDG